MHEKFFYNIGVTAIALFKIQIVWLIFNIVPLVFLISLKMDVSNIALYVVAVFVMGPSLFVLLKMAETTEEKNKVKYFVTFKKLLPKYLKETLKIWGSYILISVVLLIDIRYVEFKNVDLTLIFHIFCIILWAFITMIVLNMMIVSSYFSFSFKSLVKLSVYYLLVDFSSTLAKLVVIGVAVLTLFFLSNLFPFLLMSFWMYLFIKSSQKMLNNIKTNFTEQGLNSHKEG